MTELASWYYLAPDGCYYGPAPFEKMEHWLRKGRVPHSTPIAPFPHGPYFPATHYWLPYSGTLKRRVNFDVWFYRLHDRADAREYGPHSMAGCFELYYKREVIKPESMVRVAELSEGDYCLQDVWPQWDEVFRMAPPPEPEEQEEEEPAEEEEVEVPAEPEKPPDGMLAIMGDFRIVQIDSNGALREKVVQGHGATSSTSPTNARSPSHHRSTYGAPRALSTTYGDEQLQGHQHQGSTIVQGGGRGGSSYMSLSSRTTTAGAVGALVSLAAPSRIEGDWFYGEDGKNRIRITDGLEVADFLITLIVDGSVVEGSLRAEGGGGLLTTDAGGGGAWNVGTIAKQGTIAVKRVSPIYLEVKFKPPKAKGWLASVFAWPRFSFTVKGKWAGPFSNFQCRAWFLEGRFKRGTGEEGDLGEEAATLFRLGNDPEHRSYTLDELFPPPYQNSCFALDALPHSRNPYNESTIAADSVPIPPSAAVATSRQTTVPAAIHVAPRPQATRASSSTGAAAGAGAGVAGAGGGAASQEAELAQQLEFEEQQRVAASTVVLRSGGESGGGGAPASRGGSQAASLSFGQPSVVELRGAPSAVMGSVLLPEQQQAVPGVDVAAYPLAYPNMAAGTGSAGGGMYSAAPPPGSFYQAAGAPPSASINSDAFSLMFPSQLSRANGSAFVEHQAPASSSSSAAGEQFGSRLSSEMPSMLRAPSLYSVGFQPRSTTNALGSGMNYPAAPGAFAGAGGPRTAAVAGGSSSSTARPSFRVSEGYGVTRASGVMNNELATISIASSTAPAKPSFRVSSGYSVIRPSFTEEQTSTYYNERSSFPESAISAIPSSVAAPGSDLFAIKSEGPAQVLPSVEGTHAQEAPARAAASRHLQSGAGSTGGGKKSVTFGSAADARNDPSWWVPSAGPAEQKNSYAGAPTGTGRSSSSSSAIGLALPSSMQQGRLQQSSLVGLPRPSTSIMSAGEQEQQQRDEERTSASVVGLPRPSSMLRQEQQGLFQSSMGTGTGSRQYGSSTVLAGGEVLDEVKNTSQAQYRMEIEMQDRIEQMQQLQSRSSDHHAVSVDALPQSSSGGTRASSAVGAGEKVSWWVPSSAGDYDNGGRVGLGTSAQAPPLIQATSQEGAGAPPPGHHRSLVMRKAKSGVRESGMLMEQFLQRGRAEEREPQSGAGGGEGELPISSWWRPTEQED